VLHGKLPVLAYRFNDFAYVTDTNYLPEEAREKLQNLNLLILDAVRFEPHATHFGLYEAVDMVKELGPKRALFTHLSHHFDHDAVNAELPADMELAYDGQVIEL
jgi:phosphoribosyl 1,2-cyclic phosphate phosphodiesterase